MQRAALPVLLRLLTLPATRPHVPAVLARLIEGSEALQRAAAAADTVPLLAGLLAAQAAAVAAPAVQGVAAAAPAVAAGPAGVGVGLAGVSILGGGPAGLREGCLRALGAMCLARDDSRSQLLDSKVGGGGCRRSGKGGVSKLNFYVGREHGGRAVGVG